MQLRAYERRQPDTTVLYQVIRDNLETFLARADENAPDGPPVPAFVRKELRAFLGCGILARGFARLRCGGCGHDRLVAFSCKGRGFCPSCGGRRMTELSARLVDGIIPIVPVRQWVLSLPHRLRYKVAWNHELARAVLAVFTRALEGFYRTRARRASIPGGRTGTVTFIQRFGGALNVNPHFHTIALDGVFTESDDSELTFHPARAPTDEEVAELLERVHTRVVRLLERRGLLAASDDEHATTDEAVDDLAETSPALASCYAASINYVSGLGGRAGRPIRRLGRLGGRQSSERPLGPRRARFDGFDLHADVSIPAHDRDRLERLCRYTARPAVSHERLERKDGDIVLHLKAPWADGTEQILFEPLELLEKLAALVPRPRINLVIYHGVLAPNARWRARVVRYGRQQPAASLVPDATTTAKPRDATVAGVLAPEQRTRRRGWAELMRRAFAIDVLECPKCGGKLVLLACITERRVIDAILASLEIQSHVPDPAPARAPPDDDVVLDDDVDYDYDYSQYAEHIGA